jgi:four helix bundle protein
MSKIEDLEILKLAESLSDLLWEKVGSWDKFNRETVGKQLVRSADSIGANIAEGFGRYAMKENLHFCYYARGSFIETRYWLNRVRVRKLMSSEEMNQIREITERLGPKLNAYISYIKSSSIVSKSKSQEQ